MVASKLSPFKSDEKENNGNWLMNRHSSLHDHSIGSFNDTQQLLEENQSKHSLLGDPYKNSTKTIASRSKKSRLLRGFENTGSKRARMMPVRFSSKISMPSYVRPWIKTYPHTFWPSIALIRYLSSNSRLEPNSLSTNLLQKPSSVQIPLKSSRRISPSAYSDFKAMPEFSQLRQWTNSIKAK